MGSVVVRWLVNCHHLVAQARPQRNVASYADFRKRGSFISFPLRKLLHTGSYRQGEGKSGEASSQGDDNSLTFWRPITDNSSAPLLIASPYVDSIHPVSCCRGCETVLQL